MQWHSTLPCRTAGLPSPPPGVGRLCVRDQTQHEHFHQRAHRLCHHHWDCQHRGNDWLVHHSVTFRVIDRWWHFSERWHGWGFGCWGWPQGGDTDPCQCWRPPGGVLPTELLPWFWISPGGPWRLDGAWWLQCPPSLLVLQDRRWQGSGHRGGAWWGGQQFAACSSKPKQG